MKQAVIVTKDRSLFSIMEQELTTRGFTLTWSDSAEPALKYISTQKDIDLVILGQGTDDMDQKKLAEQIIRINPMTSCAIANSLPEKQFHDDFEGLGIIMQLSESPDASQAGKLMETMEKIQALFS